MCEEERRKAAIRFTRFISSEQQDIYPSPQEKPPTLSIRNLHFQILTPCGMLIYSQMTVVTPPSHLYRIPISNPHIRICHVKIPRVGIGTEELHAFPRRVRKDVMQVELLVVPVGLRCSGVGARLGGSAHGQCAREGSVRWGFGVSECISVENKGCWRV